MDVNNTLIQAFIDTGSTESFINHQIVWPVGLAVILATGSVYITSSSLSSSKISGTVSVHQLVKDKAYLIVKRVILHDI